MTSPPRKSRATDRLRGLAQPLRARAEPGPDGISMPQHASLEDVLTAGLTPACGSLRRRLVVDLPGAELSPEGPGAEASAFLNRRRPRRRTSRASPSRRRCNSRQRSCNQRRRSGRARCRRECRLPRKALAAAAVAVDDARRAGLPARARDRGRTGRHRVAHARAAREPGVAARASFARTRARDARVERAEAVVAGRCEQHSSSTPQLLPATLQIAPPHTLPWQASEQQSCGDVAGCIRPPRSRRGMTRSLPFGSHRPLQHVLRVVHELSGDVQAPDGKQ